MHNLAVFGGWGDTLYFIDIDKQTVFGKFLVGLGTVYSLELIIQFDSSKIKDAFLVASGNNYQFSPVQSDVLDLTQYFLLKKTRPKQIAQLEMLEIIQLKKKLKRQKNINHQIILKNNKLQNKNFL